MDRTQNENTIQYMKHTKYGLKSIVCVSFVRKYTMYLLPSTTILPINSYEFLEIHVAHDISTSKDQAAQVAI